MKLKLKIEFIDNYLKENKMSKKEFCKCCGFTSYYLKELYKNNTKLSSFYLCGLAKVLKIKIDDFLVNEEE